jgi:hypothetical protein
MFNRILLMFDHLFYVLMSDLSRCRLLDASHTTSSGTRIARNPGSGRIISPFTAAGICRAEIMSRTQQSGAAVASVAANHKKKRKSLSCRAMSPAPPQLWLFPVFHNVLHAKRPNRA